MTVASLWKVLDKAECGKPIGAREMVDPSAPLLSTVHPWNHHEQHRPQSHRTTTTNAGTIRKPTTLAVDLSIWICEGLLSYGMSEQHVNPALHLVFTRTMKLLNLGIHLVFVIEGKQRIRDFTGDEEDKFRKRRSGTNFWMACNDCQQLLELLGVPVVRAKAEGEALCALLNLRGIVDGVISNDGDCLLFGAKTIYTKFSCDNLDKGCVMRYDLDNLHAILEATEEDDPESEICTLQLSRQDLVAFAILTGSDLAGSGLTKVGYKKAVRFIRKCQLDNPLTMESAAIDDMKSWAKAATANATFRQFMLEGKGACCSKCTHAGTKRGHLKHGCEICATGPGEACYEVTKEDRFRRSMRAKALAIVPKFDPSKILEIYMRPNDNQLPMQLVGASVNGIQMGPPQLSVLFNMPLIVTGSSLTGSREFIRKAVSRYLSRKELLQTANGPLATNRTSNAVQQRIERERPVARAIVKALTRDQVPCFEVSWIVSATITDCNGNGVDGYEYITVEPRDLVEQKYPALIDAYNTVEIERAKQGDDQQNKRRDFLETYLFIADANAVDHTDGHVENKKRQTGKIKKREFNRNEPPIHETRANSAWKRRRKAEDDNLGGDDVGNLLKFVVKIPLQFSPAKSKFRSNEHSTIESFTENGLVPKFDELPRNTDSQFECNSKSRNLLQTPRIDVESLFVTLGGYEIEISPVESNRGVYPPKHVFVRAEYSITP